MQNRNAGREVQCTGALIDATHVLTSANCVFIIVNMTDGTRPAVPKWQGMLFSPGATVELDKPKICRLHACYRCALCD